ncbi:MAG: nuoM, partial [Acidimicrobiales bacterium]|nr:nuoM [Acidimicrobiales bacterium]
MSPLLAAETAGSFPLLTAVVVLPAIGALVTALVSKRRPELAKQSAVLFAVATGALTIAVLARFDTHAAGFQMIDHVRWVQDPQISWTMGVDGISLWMVVLTGILFPIAMLGAPPHRDEKPFYAWLLLLEAGCLGAFLALDLFVFFLMFEIVLVPMYFLIGQWGYGNRTYAA